MNGPTSFGPGGRLIQRAQNLAGSLEDLIAKADVLLLEAKEADDQLSNCANFRDENLLKHLAVKNTDEAQMQILRDNAELKATADEFRGGIEQIMTKYREHCDGDMFSESYQLRERYMTGLAAIVQHQNERIEQMAEVMQLTVELEDRASDSNQKIIRQLYGENEKMRRQLQISCGDQLFPQGALGSSESSTQFDLSQSTDPDASGETSLDSLESFLSCLSTKGFDDDDSDNSSAKSGVSQLEVNRLIDEALAEGIEELPSPSHGE